jgi:hypothetical protein
MHNPRIVASRITEGANALLHECEVIFFILGIMVGVTSEKRREKKRNNCYYARILQQRFASLLTL